MKRLSLHWAALGVLAASLAAQPVISTIAGGGPYSGPALATNVAFPSSMIPDGAGNLFIAAAHGHRVFKMDAGGNLTAYAGIGAPAMTGDGGPAASAGLFIPYSIARDSSGNLYIADYGNNRVRRVSVAGVITTVAGDGVGRYSGEGTATNVSLWRPKGVAVDPAGNLYIADSANNRIRRVSGGVMTTIAGNGLAGFDGDGGPAASARFFSPRGLAYSSGSLYIADEYNNRVRRVDLTTGIITTVAGNGDPGYSGDGGPATSTKLNIPSGVAVDAGGNLFIADTYNHRIRRVDLAGNITTVAGTALNGFAGDGGPAVSAPLRMPTGVAFDADGNLLIGDSDNHRVRKVVSGIISTIAGNGTRGHFGDGGPATSASFFAPSGIALDSSGNMFIGVYGDRRVRKVDTGGVITTIAGGGTGGDGPATSASLEVDGMAMDAAGNIYVAGYQRVWRISEGMVATVAGNGSQGFSGDGGPATSAQLGHVRGIGLDAAGNLYIADVINHRVRRVDTYGIITTVAGNGTINFSGDGGPATSAGLPYPNSVAVDSSGNLFVTDGYRVRRVSASTGIITTIAGNGYGGYGHTGVPALSVSLANPTALTFDSLGNLYLAESDRIRRVNTAGIIETVAGYWRGFSGDGGPAINAQLHLPHALTIDGSGVIYIADYGNGRIRKVASNGLVSQPIDPVTGTRPISMTFSNVTQPGTTTVTTSTTGAPPPSGFKLGTPPVYYDLTTTAGFSGPVTVCISYSGSNFGNESNLKLFHQEGNQWVDRTTSLDTVNNIICGTVASFSWFSIFETEIQKPVVSNVAAAPNPAPVGGPITLTASISDIATGVSRIVAAEYNIGGGAYMSMSAVDGAFDAASENLTASVAPLSQSDVYTFCVRGTDAAGNLSLPVCTFLAVYNPDGGFVSGGGWINSPPAAYTADPGLAGRASFAFVSRYEQGAQMPSGNTQFQFQVANLTFKSTSYDWLVISGARAQFKGSGTINGVGDYAFLLTAIDGQVNGGGGGVDRFRIKIWNKQGGGVIYDNQAGKADYADDATELGGGSILIHKP